MSICQKCWIQIECFDRFYLRIEELYRNYCWPENVFAESINPQWPDIVGVIRDNKEEESESTLNIYENRGGDFAGVPLEVKMDSDRNECENDFFDDRCAMEYVYDEKPIIESRATRTNSSTKNSIKAENKSDEDDSGEDDIPLTTRRKTYKKSAIRQTNKTKKSKKKSDDDDDDEEYLPENDEDSPECKRTNTQLINACRMKMFNSFHSR